ncbi:craniofacial development protein 2-like [Nilaparvata lugens]|uniref:craniofacial development protein 2-like n=1 Tax=Nilaparvata lugens TaxID=108931 RepID=UPI00193D734B|nr:craniofacial development protein 2-like [Nilaparvata lugens]
MFYSSVDSNARNGVGIIVDRHLKEEVMSVERRNDRIMSLRLNVGETETTLLSVYAPQIMGRDEAEKDELWSAMDEVMMAVPKEDGVLVGGDLNGHVGGNNDEEERVFGRQSFGRRNEGGQRIVDHAVAFDLAIMDTFFRKREEQLITYRSGGRRSQIDYLLWRRYHLEEIKDVKVINGDNVSAQHKLLVMD